MQAQMVGMASKMQAASAAAMGGRVDPDTMTPTGAADGYMSAGRTVYLRSQEGTFLGVNAGFALEDKGMYAGADADCALYSLPGRFIRLQSVGNSAFFLQARPDSIGCAPGHGSSEWRLDRAAGGLWALFCIEAHVYLAVDSRGFVVPSPSPHGLSFSVLHSDGKVEAVPDLRAMDHGSVLVVQDATSGNCMGVNPSNGAIGAMAKSFASTSQFFVQITREVMLRSATHGTATGPGFIRMGDANPATVSTIRDAHGVGGIESAFVIVDAPAQGAGGASFQAVRAGHGGRAALLTTATGCHYFTIQNA
jgi:hypothetical protein